MSDASASSGGRLGRYHLVEPIGGGPNGEVHRAKVYGVAGFERQFAVKKFFPHVALNSRYATALSAAARAYGSLEHPRIARLAEFGVSSGHTFTATELVPGIDAARLLAETLGAGSTIPAGSALSLVSQAARAVGYAHGRGISHLGVAPTNLIITPEGEVKVTDVGVLGACLPDRPAHDGRFVTRVHYLAPEQLTGEPCSAATDVFALGLIAYELVTGERAFIGMTPEDVAQAILAGQPREPQLPRPIMRVLQRCLARSPYERFPDARALADALDAAVRVSPVPGTRGEVADLVGAAMRRIIELHEQQLSGALSLNLPSAGVRMDTLADRPQHGDGHEIPTLPFFREAEPERTLPELGKQGPAPTLQGMAPPPIPVPQGVASPPPAGPPMFVPSATLQGVAAARPQPRAPTGGLPPPIPRPVAPASDITDVNPAPVHPRAERAPIAGPGSSGRLPPLPRPVSDPGRFATSDPTVDARRMETGEPVASDSSRMETGEPVPAPGARRMTTGEPVPPPPLPSGGSGAMGRASPLDGMPPVRGGPPASYETFQALRTASNSGLTEDVRLAGKGRNSKLIIAVIAIVATAAGVIVGWQLLDRDDTGGTGSGGKTGAVPGVAIDAARVAAATPDAAPTIAAATDAAAGAVDAAQVAAGTIDASAATAAPDAAQVAAATPDAAAAAAATPDAAKVAAATPDAAAPTAVPDDKLVIETNPSGARVYLDGADQGQTPVSLPGSNDRHSIALVLPGHAPYIAELDGHGKFTIALDEVTPTGGPAGIKVKCKERGRYWVFLDGKPTGQACPTERLEVELGEHVIEIYDVVTETKRQFPANVKETRLSLRIKVDY